MCLSTAWELGEQGANKMLCEYVSTIGIMGDTITLTDLMGRELVVSGSLQSVDLIKNAITIRVKKGVTGMKKYERIREILNSCDNSRMRDVDIQEVESDDLDTSVKEFCNGKNVRCEKFVKNDGTVVFDISVDGLNQRVTYMELVEKA
jgi:predicted RNA-binding protein